jgi:hypothetical protein
MINSFNVFAGVKEEAGNDEAFSVKISQWLLFLQRSGW